MGESTMRRTSAKLIILGLLGFCTSIGSAALAQQTGTSPTAVSPKIPYGVENIILGDEANADTLTQRAYDCSPSEQFTGFTWCTSKSSKARVRTAYSILHSPDERIVYANKTLESAFSSSTEAKEELQRISQKIGTQPKIIEMPNRSGLLNGFIAVWGNVALKPVDAANTTKLADGKSPKLGFIVDFITDFQRSAKTGLPIYRIGGGAGLILAVSYGKPDKGTLRLIAVDASKFSSPLAEQSSQGPVVAQQAPATDQSPIATQSFPARDQMTIAVQPSIDSGQSATVAQPSSQPINKGDESQTNIAELKHTISSLRSELATSGTMITRLKNQISEAERQLKQEAQSRLSAEAAKNQIEQTMRENRGSRAGFWTVLASIIFGGLITLLAIRSPTLSNQLAKWNLSAKLSNVDQWLGHFERKISSVLASFPKGRSRDSSVKQVAEMDVTTQPS